MYVEIQLRHFKNIKISYVILASYDSLINCVVYDSAFLKLLVVYTKR